MSSATEEYEQRIRELYVSGRTKHTRVHPLSEEDLRAFLAKGNWKPAALSIVDPGHFAAVWETPGAGRIFLRFLGGGWVNYDLSFNGRVRDRGQVQMHKIQKVVTDSQLESEIMISEESTQ